MGIGIVAVTFMMCQHYAVPLGKIASMDLRVIFLVKGMAQMTCSRWTFSGTSAQEIHMGSHFLKITLYVGWQLLPTMRGIPPCSELTMVLYFMENSPVRQAPTSNFPTSLKGTLEIGSGMWTTPWCDPCTGKK